MVNAKYLLQKYLKPIQKKEQNINIVELYKRFNEYYGLSLSEFRALKVPTAIIMMDEIKLVKK